MYFKEFNLLQTETDKKGSVRISLVLIPESYFHCSLCKSTSKKALKSFASRPPNGVFVWVFFAGGIKKDKQMTD